MHLPNDDRIKCYNMLSFYYNRLSANEINVDQHQSWKQDSIKYLNCADNIRLGSPETFVNKIYYMISQGELPLAENYLENLKAVERTNPLINWLQALIDYNRGSY